MHISTEKPEVMMTNQGFEIVARKPRPGGGEFAVIKRRAKSHPYVSCTIDHHSLSLGGWYWGHYFETEAQAMAHFNAR